MRNLEAIPRSNGLTLLGAASLAYVLLYPWLYRTLEDGAALFLLVPVLLASWFYGLLAGLASGLAASVVHFLLLMLVNGLPAEQALTGEVLGAAPVLFLVGGVVGYLSDLRRKLAEQLAARQQVELALRVSEAFNQAVLQALSANIAVLSRTGEIIAVNGAWIKFARDNNADEGRTGVGMNYLQVCRNSTGEGTESALQAVMGIQSVLEGREALFTMEYSCHAPGQKRWYVMHVTPLMHEQGGAVVSHINITDRVLSEQKLAYLATHDALTGLYNRAYFELETARLQQEQAAPVSVVIADIDGLKQVNDQQGHAAGDALLRRAAEVLKSAFRDEDVLARIGGDEFAVILPGMDERMAQLIPDRVALRMREAALQASPEDEPLRISLGVSTAERSEDLPAAVKLADERMYQEKESKKRDS